jgi:hypothetical protein
VLSTATAMHKVEARVRIPAVALPAPHNSKIHGKVSKFIRNAARRPANIVFVGLGQGQTGVQVPGSDWSDNWAIHDDEGD